jgi:hypothetical protein
MTSARCELSAATNHPRQLIPRLPVNRFGSLRLRPRLHHLPFAKRPQTPNPSHPFPKRIFVIRLHPPKVLMSIHVCLDPSAHPNDSSFLRHPCPTVSQILVSRVRTLVLRTSRYCNGFGASLRRLPRLRERKTLALTPRLPPDSQSCYDACSLRWWVELSAWPGPGVFRIRSAYRPPWPTWPARSAEWESATSPVCYSTFSPDPPPAPRRNKLSGRQAA